MRNAKKKGKVNLLGIGLEGDFGGALGTFDVESEDLMDAASQ